MKIAYLIILLLFPFTLSANSLVLRAQNIGFGLKQIDANKTYTSLTIGEDYTMSFEVVFVNKPILVSDGSTFFVITSPGPQSLSFTASSTNHSVGFFHLSFGFPARIELDDVVLTKSEEVTDLVCVTLTDTDYRYAFGGHEKDDEVKPGIGNSYTTQYRQYDPRLGRWLTMDPVMHHHFTPYSAYDNKPIIFPDPTGADIPVQFTDEQMKNVDENGVPKDVQALFNKEYGIKVGLTEEGALTYLETVNPEQMISMTARNTMKEKLMPDAENTGYLVFVNDKDMETAYFSKETEVDGTTFKNATVINTYYFNDDFTMKGDYEGDWTDFEKRSQNMARVLEHEYIGHFIRGLDDDYWSGGKSAGVGGAVVVSNQIREEIGLGHVQRMQYNPTEGGRVLYGDWSIDYKTIRKYFKRNEELPVGVKALVPQAAFEPAPKKKK